MSTAVLEWSGLLPLILVFGGAVIGVLIEALVPRSARRATQIIFTLAVLAAALVALVWRFTAVLASGPSSLSQGTNGKSATGFGVFAEDPVSLGFSLIIVICSLLAVLVMIDRTSTGEGSFAASAATVPGSTDEREANEAGYVQSEIFPLSLFAVGGMIAFTMANDLLTLFIALEALSLPLYVLTATARRRRALSQEAAMKYFLLGAFSSAFFLMGAALLYGFAGSYTYIGILQVVRTGSGMDLLFLAGCTLVLIGLLFKVGAVPFHSWTPDTYQGAPTPVTGFMAAGTKIAAFAAMLRFAYSVGNGGRWELTPVLWVIIILTMLVGTVSGLVQKDIKRLLAYSSIAHAGFILIGVSSFLPSGINSVAFYLLAYGLATIGAFGAVTLVRSIDSRGNILGEATSLDAWKGLGKTNPWLASAMMIFLLSFAGIPLTAGFVGKFAVFSAGVASDQTPLVVIAVLCSAATAFFYFRLIALMFLHDPAEDTLVVSSEGFTLVAVLLCAIATVVIGIWPAPVFNFLSSVMVFML